MYIIDIYVHMRVCVYRHIYSFNKVLLKALNL